MSKTVKHCQVCQENFGDRFSFCPVCGETLKTVEVGSNEALPSAASVSQSNARREETVATAAAANLTSGETNAPVFQQKAASANGASSYQSNESPAVPQNFDTNPEQFHDDGLFHLTILQAPKNHRRDFGFGALFGLGFLLVSLTGLWVWGLYQTDLNSDPVGDDPLVYAAYLADEAPVEEEKEPERKDDKKGGGGGGGGKKDPKPVQEGIMPKMDREKQVIAPDVDRVVKPNFELKQQAKLEGPEQKPNPSLERYGVVNGAKDASGGWGGGRGLGSGGNGGVGTGDGPGYGSGRNGGIGSGSNGGIGSGDGPGSGRDEPPPVKKAPPEPATVVSEPLKILSQPRPGYTEEARKNNVQGTVRVRVTFSASGQVAGVSAVTSLPYGLTEKAIAAARQISFVPAKKNGVATAVTKVIEYRFTMY